jgi:acetate kinase
VPGEEPRLSYRFSVDLAGSVPQCVMEHRSGDPVDVTRVTGNALEACLAHVLSLISARRDAPAIKAVGHRIVHGGDEFAAPVRLDDAIIGRLEALAPLAPLHQPVNLALVNQCRASLPGVAQIGCFDTTFHHEQDELVRRYGLPEALTRKGIHRFGFHGTSYESVLYQLRESIPALATRSIIVAHLGAGSSLCAIRDGRSIATTMGFSTADGLPMGTRCGSIDPGVLIYLIREHGMTADSLEDLLYRRSGLLGISGVSASMSALRDSAAPRAQAAIDFFVYRCVREIGSLAAALGGLDALVFTGGIGENDVLTRLAIGEQCRWLGVHMDRAANESASERISTRESPVGVYVIPSNEELMIARHALRLGRD